MRVRLITVAFLFVVSVLAAQVRQFPKWEKGYLDIHQISTGRGNASFIVFPDGTTLLVDAGDTDIQAFNTRYAPMFTSPALPDSSVSAARVIKNYIDKVYGTDLQVIDYFVLTHYHSDHYGSVRPGLSMAEGGGYVRTGVTELGDLLDFRTFIVRDYPENTASFQKYIADKDPTFANLLRFIEYKKETKGIRVQCVEVGSDRQIIPLRDSIFDFSVRNVKANDQLWTGYGKQIRSLFPYGDFKGTERFENTLSAAFLIRYGSFKYFFGGDNTGLCDQDHEAWFDVETPMSEVVGKVDVAVLNHHGNRDATNRNFLENLDPRVVVLPSWCTDQPGAEVAMRLISPWIGTRDRKIFMTYYHPETTVAIGPWFERKLTSKRGHIVIRVAPDGKYMVYVLDDSNLDVPIKDSFE